METFHSTYKKNYKYRQGNVFFLSLGDPTDGGGGDPKISIFFWLTLLFMYFLKLGRVPFLEFFDWRTPSLPKSQLCDLPFILIINVL